MTAVTFDTHAFIKRLVASGMPEPQAETVTALVWEAQSGALEEVATRRDIREETAPIKAELLHMNSAAGGLATKGDIKEETAPIKAELLLMKWMVGFVLAFQIAIFAKMFVH